MTSCRRHVLILLQTVKPCEPVGCVYLIRTFTANICAFYLVLFNKSLHSLFIVRQAAMETQTLLCLCQPLQQDVNRGMKLLSLIPGDTDQSGNAQTLYPLCDGRGSAAVPDTAPAPGAPAWTPRGCTHSPSGCSAPASAP